MNADPLRDNFQPMPSRQSRDALRMHIRPAQARDADQIARVHVRAVQDGYRGAVAGEVLDGLDEVKRGVEWLSAIEKLRADKCLYVAILGERVVGFAGGGPARKSDEREMGELYVLNVDPTAWRMGIGAAMAGTVESWLASQFQNAVLWVLEGNTRARHLYESRGWTKDGTTREDELYAAPALRYRKTL